MIAKLILTSGLGRALLALSLVAAGLSPAVATAVDRSPVGASRASLALDLLPRVECPTGYTASVYAEGLSSPDGLAFGPDGALYVAEEGAGQVSRIGEDGTVMPWIGGLNKPEGITFDDAGNLYVVEDRKGGRLVQVAPNGAFSALATDLNAPEGVTLGLDGSLYITESNIQFASDPFDFQTKVVAVSAEGITQSVRTDVVYWSYSGITFGPGGRLYVANEVSGAANHESIFTVDPVTGERNLFVSNLITPEGLRFSASGGFPLYVAQEDTGDDAGMVSRVEANGTHTPLCTGFEDIEDVIQDADGRLYVSEDSTGLIIVIEPDLPPKSQAQAIILFIGDGMGEAHRTAARWSAAGQSGALAMDGMPALGWARTAPANGIVTDSAAAATALATGVKTNNGVIGQDPNGNSLTTILERAQAIDMAVGLVTTVEMAHATPAAFAAHVPDRSMMTEIASQMLATRVDVLLGGGEADFLPEGAAGCHGAGRREDGRDLVGEAEAAGYIYVCSQSDFAALVPTSTTHLLGLFADQGMPRPYAPSLAEMTQKAIDILAQDPDGFFLMVEGGQIDWASHANDAVSAISDTVGLDEAVAVAKAYAASAGNTLVIVTADHETGGMGVDLTAGEQGPFTMPGGTPFYVNWSPENHTSADVPSTAQGPWSDLLDGTYENTYIHDVMRLALEDSPALYLPIILKEISRLIKSPFERNPIMTWQVVEDLKVWATELQ